MKNKILMSVALVAGLSLSVLAEAPYAFRQRLVTVHRQDRRDLSLKAGADEFEFPNGAVIVVPDEAPALVCRAAEDFADYLIVSMGVNASVRTASSPLQPGLAAGVTVALKDLGRRGYELETGRDGVRLAASDEKMAAQAFYHLEDRMNLRRGPFLSIGTERRSPYFEHRITFAGFGNDIFPDAHLNQIAHHGFTDIEIWLGDYDVPSQGVRQDINDLCERAAKFGLGAYFQPRNRAYVHPSDPKAAEMYEAAYGRLAKYYPKAVAISFNGEVCEFPSKDPRCNGGDHLHRKPEDKAKGLPYPGWFPCSDWADWVRVVKPIVNGYNPDCRFVFSTYNWGFRDAKARADLIAALPKGVTLRPTFEMFEKHEKRNGLVSPVADYSLAFPGPGKYFLTEAAQAKELGLELWSNCNSAGLTWDFGNIPYQPAPWQWKKKWDGLKDAHVKWNLSGLRENHEYGWYPSFIAELEKEFMWEGGMDFDAHVRAIAVRDYGEANADAAMEAWRLWSRAAADYVPTDENQYGPCRIGPAYPFNFYGPDLQKESESPEGFPLAPGAVFRICHFDFAKPIHGLGTDSVALREEWDRKEIELFESQVEDYRKGSETFRRIAAALPEGRRDEAVRMAALGEYLMRACLTTLNLKKGRIAWRKGDRAEVERLAKAEYANAEAALKVVDEDSRLGWLASSDYTGGRAQIEWKLRKMRELYGPAVCGQKGYARVCVDVSALPSGQAFVGELLRSRIAERVSESEQGPAFQVRYALDPDVKGEDAVVTVKDGTAEIRAGRLRGLVAGTGNLLKSFGYRETSFAATDGSYDFRPAKSLRMAYFARHFLNWYMEAPADELCRYIDDLALDGINSFSYQFAMPLAYVPHVAEGRIEEFERISYRMSERVAELDCDFCASGGNNQMPLDTPEKFRGVPNSDPKRGNLGFNACPAIPGALEAMMANRVKSLGTIEGVRVGFFNYWSFDEGGCECETCKPWGGKGMLGLIEKFHAVNRKAHPEAKALVSTWVFHDDDFEGLWKYIETHDWIDYVICDSHTEFPTYPLKHPICGRTKIITFPEISMYGRKPWGGYGATVLPDRMERLFRQADPVSDGFMYYSEGSYEDLNKALEVGLYVNPKTHADDILAQYARYHFAGTDPKDLVTLAHLLERNHDVFHLEDAPTAEAKALVGKMDREILPRLRKSWRWRLVYLRAMIDRGIFETKDRQAKCLHPYFDELVEMYHAKVQLQAVLDGFVGGWTCPAYEPEGCSKLVRFPPPGDATGILEALFKDRTLRRIRLGSGEWRLSPVEIVRSEPALEITLLPGCRLLRPDGTPYGKPSEAIRIAKASKRVKLVDLTAK